MVSKIILGICVVCVNSVSMASWQGEEVMFPMDIDVTTTSQSVSSEEDPLFPEVDDSKDPPLRAHEGRNAGDKTHSYKGAENIWGMQFPLPADMDTSLLPGPSNVEGKRSKGEIPRETSADDVEAFVRANPDIAGDVRVPYASDSSGESDPVAPKTAPISRRVHPIKEIESGFIIPEKKVVLSSRPDRRRRAKSVN